MKELPVHKGEDVVAFTKVDDEDFETANAYRWYLSTWNYAVAAGGKRAVIVLLHHIILPKAAGLVTDHINRDSLDNQRCNLRRITQQQNTFNSGPSRNNTSGFKGVSLDKRRGKWIAKIQKDGRTISLGGYLCPIQAAIAYNAGVLAHFDGFGYLNEIPT